jgi:hypothetical protein
VKENSGPFIFVTFERYVTHLRGTFVLVPISTHPINQATEVNTVDRKYRKFARLWGVWII